MEKTNKLLVILIILILIPELLILFAIIDPSGKIEKYHKKNDAIDAFCDEFALNSSERKKIKIKDYWYRNGDKLYGLIWQHDEGKMVIEYDDEIYTLTYYAIDDSWDIETKYEDDWYEEDYEDEEEDFSEFEEESELNDTSDELTSS